jgi:hypothetical protein
MKLLCNNPKLTVWVDGKELKPGDYMGFELGFYSLLVRSAATHRLPVEFSRPRLRYCGRG